MEQDGKLGDSLLSVKVVSVCRICTMVLQNEHVVFRLFRLEKSKTNKGPVLCKDSLIKRKGVSLTSVCKLLKSTFH